MKTHAELLEALNALIESVKDDATLNASILTEEGASGSAIPASHLVKIKKWTQKDIDPESIHTYPILMIDDGPTRNAVIYTAESQKKTVKKWAGTPFLFNAAGTQGLFDNGPDHKLQAASQFGRLYDAKVVNTPKGQVGTLGWMYAVEGIDEATDAFIKKLDAGILREVSIHVTVPEGVQCSICNGPFSQCMEKAKTDHYPREKYGNKVCYMSTGSGALGPLELSAVACPGSVNAHVMQDDEVEDYPVVSLREALGGSAEAIQQITQEKDMRTKEQIADARKKLQEAAATAGVTLKEFVGDDKNKTIVEEANVTVENVEVEIPIAENIVCEKCKKENTPADAATHECVTEPVVKPKQETSLIGDDEVCVVCKREANPKPAEGQAETAIRAEFKETVTKLITKSEEAINAANARAEAAEVAAKDAVEMKADLCETVVTLATKFGIKKSSESDAYRETLLSLPYQAVKEIRESLRPREVKAETATERIRLEESAVERAKREHLSTHVQTDKDGRTSEIARPRARLAAR